MARFCMYCGSPLEEGQVCSCPEAQAAAQAAAQQPPQAPPAQQPYTPPAPRKPSAVGGAFKNLVPFGRAYLRSPIAATRSAVSQKDWVLGIVLLSCLTLAGFLASISLLLRQYLDAHSFFYGAVVLVPFLLHVLFDLLTCAFAAAAFWFLLYLALKVIKAERSLKDVLTAAGVNGMFPAALLVLAFLFGFLSRPLGLAFVAAAALVWALTVLFAGQALVSDPEQGKFCIACILTVLAVLLAAWLFHAVVSLIPSAVFRTIIFLR